MMLLAETNVSDILEKVNIAVQKVQHAPNDAAEMHEKICKMYSWKNVAQRTEKVAAFFFN